MKLRFLLAICLLVGLHLPAFSQNFFFDDWTPRTFEGIPSFVEISPPGGPPTVTVTVNAADTVARVSPLVYGNNAVAWQQVSHTVPERVRHYRNAGISILRFPGGGWSDQYFWDARMSEDLPDDIGPMYPDGRIDAVSNWDWWKLSPEDFYVLLDSIGAEAIITVNLGYARYGTSEDPVANAAHYAAEWVRDVNVRRGLGVKYWEVGNENFGDWEAGSRLPDASALDGAEYGRLFNIFADSMKAADPSIKVGAVVFDMPSSHDLIHTSWNRLLFPVIRDKADFLSVHHYFSRGWPPTFDTPAQLFATLAQVRAFTQNVSSQWTQWAGADPIPIALTEYNIFSEEKYKATSHLNGLFFASVIGEIIRHGYGMANMWDLKNGWENGKDHGLLASADEPGVEEDTPHPVFFPYYFYTRLFGDVMVSASASKNTIKAYASRFTSGETGIVLVNPTAADETVLLDLREVAPEGRYYVYEVQHDDPDSRTVTINGVGTSQEGGGPENYEAVPALSGPIEGELLLTMKQYSANYVLVETREGVTTATELPEAAVPVKTEVFPNPARDRVFVRYVAREPQTLRMGLFDVTGRLVRKEAARYLQKGAHTLTLDVAGLPSGIYFLALEKGNEGREVHKITVVR